MQAVPSFSTPKIITKNLAFAKAQGRRKVRLSTNFLPLMGFEPGDRISAVPTGNANGFKAVLDAKGAYKIHERKYRNRGNNPLETLIEFQGQGLIDSSFPSYTERFHVQLKKGEVVFSPMANRAFGIIDRFKKHDPYSALVAFSGGVDISLLKQGGFKTEVVIEYRPDEKRDIAAGRSLTEAHALGCIANSEPSVLINEDIYTLEMDRFESLLDNAPPVALGSFSIQCDDHSNAKSAAAKAKAIEDGSTTMDMVWPVLRSIETAGFPVVLVECVPGFLTSPAGEMFRAVMRRMGYFANEQVHNSLDFGATQRRKRYTGVFSVFPGYEPPQPTGEVDGTLEEMIRKHLGDCHDVTHTKLLDRRAAKEAKGRKSPPFVQLTDKFCGTIMKSQGQWVDDAQYIEVDGRVYLPSPGLLRDLMSIPDSFNIDFQSKEMQAMTYGQSVDGKLHAAIIRSIKEHIDLNFGQHTLVKHSQQSAFNF